MNSIMKTNILNANTIKSKLHLVDCMTNELNLHSEGIVYV